MDDVAREVVHAIIWVGVGAIPTLFGFGIVAWADIRSCRKSINSAFQKIRELEKNLPKEIAWGGECRKDDRP